MWSQLITLFCSSDLIVESSRLNSEGRNTLTGHYKPAFQIWRGGEYREMLKRTLWCVCSQRGWKHSRHHCVAFIWSKWRNDPDRRLATEELKTWHWESSSSLRQTGIVGVSKAMKFHLRVPAGPLTHSSRETWLMPCRQGLRIMPLMCAATSYTCIVWCH